MERRRFKGWRLSALRIYDYALVEAAALRVTDTASVEVNNGSMAVSGLLPDAYLPRTLALWEPDRRQYRRRPDGHCWRRCVLNSIGTICRGPAGPAWSRSTVSSRGGTIAATSSSASWAPVRLSSVTRQR